MPRRGLVEGLLDQVPIPQPQVRSLNSLAETSLRASQSITDVLSQLDLLIQQFVGFTQLSGLFFEVHPGIGFRMEQLFAQAPAFHGILRSTGR